MIYALQRAAEEMAADIKKYDILVDPRSHAVGNKQGVMVLQPYSSKRICRAAITKYIKIAKADESAEAMKNQASLF